jgi:hypothetical protein
MLTLSVLVFSQGEACICRSGPSWGVGGALERENVAPSISTWCAMGVRTLARYTGRRAGLRLRSGPRPGAKQRFQCRMQVPHGRLSRATGDLDARQRSQRIQGGPSATKSTAFGLIAEVAVEPSGMPRCNLRAASVAERSEFEDATHGDIGSQHWSGDCSRRSWTGLSPGSTAHARHAEGRSPGAAVSRILLRQLHPVDGIVRGSLRGVDPAQWTSTFSKCGIECCCGIVRSIDSCRNRLDSSAGYGGAESRVRRLVKLRQLMPQ